VGRSGSGKTTATKLLMRFFDPERGKIIIDNVNIKDLTKSNLRSFFGVVPQEPILFNNTIGYNIAYGGVASSAYNIGCGSEKENNLKEIKVAAKMANIDKFIEKLPNKYESNVGERGIKLSGGQKQRLARMQLWVEVQQQDHKPTFAPEVHHLLSDYLNLVY